MNVNKLLERAMNFKSEKYIVTIEYCSLTTGVRVNIQEKVVTESGVSEIEPVASKTFYFDVTYGDSLEELYELIGAYETKLS